MSDVMSENPLVSILMITYNHELFITQAIDSILMQNINFSYEIVIGEDCSTDGTRDIIVNYKKKYGDQLKLIMQETNVGMMNNFIKTYTECTGKYIATLDGDDYWTDPYKLQKQIDFLEKNPDYAICFHNMRIIDEDQPHLTHMSNIKQKEITDINTLALGNYIFTASCVFRKNFSRIPDWFYQCPVGDYPLHLLNAQYGKIKFIDEVMGVYRVHQGGIWENKNYSYRLEESIKMLEIIRTKFDKKINKTLNNILYDYCFELAIHSLKNNDFTKYEIYLAKIKGNHPFVLNILRICFLHILFLLRNRGTITST